MLSGRIKGLIAFLQTNDIKIFKATWTGRCLTCNSLFRNSLEYSTWPVIKCQRCSPLPVCKSTFNNSTNPVGQPWAHSHRTSISHWWQARTLWDNVRFLEPKNTINQKGTHTQLHRLHYWRTVGPQPGREGRALSFQNASFMDGATLMGTKSWFLNVYWSAVSKRWVSIYFKQKKILVLPSSHKWNERLKKTGPVMFSSPGSCSYLVLTKANPRASAGFWLGSRLMNEYDYKFWKGFVSSFLQGWGRGGDSQQSLSRSEDGEGLPQSLEEKLQQADHSTHLASSLTPLHS